MRCFGWVFSSGQVSCVVCICFCEIPGWETGRGVTIFLIWAAAETGKHISELVGPKFGIQANYVYVCMCSGLRGLNGGVCTNIKDISLDWRKTLCFLRL